MIKKEAVNKMLSAVYYLSGGKLSDHINFPNVRGIKHSIKLKALSFQTCKKT